VTAFRAGSVAVARALEYQILGVNEHPGIA
jgi:hypothetical protein